MTTTTDIPAPESIRVSQVAPGTPCEVHDEPAAGLAERLLQLVMARGQEGVVACRECFARARYHHDARCAAYRAAVDQRSWPWPERTPVRMWPHRWRAGVFTGEPVTTFTRSESWLADGKEVVMVEGEPGGISVRRLERIETTT